MVGEAYVGRMMRFVVFKYLGRLLLLLIIAGGCQPTNTPPASMPSGGESPLPVRSSATTASSPRRIIAFAPNAAEIIADLGAADDLVAVGDFCNWPPEIAGRPRVGGLFDPNLEAIIRLRPDLLVLRGRNDDLLRLCAERGIRIYHDPTERMEDIYTILHELGELLGRREAAQQVEQEMRTGLRRIASVVAGRSRPRVFITVARQPDSLANVLTASRGTFVQEIVELAGGENVFADLAMTYPQVSPEAILAAQPEVIIEVMPEAKGGEALTSRVRELWRKLGPMPAVQNDRVYVLADENALTPAPRIVKVVARVARLLHPEAGEQLEPN